VRDGARSRRPRRGGLARVRDGMRSRHSVEPASYETDLTRDLKWAAFCRGFSYFSFLLSMDMGTPILLVPTVAPEPLGECVITLPGACFELES
jgi:hypothetical protein